MLLPSKDGIICDLCGSIHKLKFEYYSIEYAKVTVDCKAQTSRTESDAKILNLDICVKCYDEQCEQVKKLIEKREKEGVWS